MIRFGREVGENSLGTLEGFKKASGLPHDHSPESRKLCLGPGGRPKAFLPSILRFPPDGGGRPLTFELGNVSSKNVGSQEKRVKKALAADS